WRRVTDQGELNAAKKAGGTPWTVRVFDAATGKPVGPPIDVGRRAGRDSVTLGQDGKRVAVVRTPPGKGPEDGDAGVATVWDTATGRPLAEFTGIAGSSWRQTVEFVGDRLLVVSVSPDFGKPRRTVFDLETGKPAAIAEKYDRVFGTPDGR